ncbi:hypothetical protein [Paenibacillus daejeonensis]|nr:hypothetical protein [Paenibacillus daejeonensis]
MKEKREKPIALNKKETTKTTETNNQAAMKAAKKVMDKYEKTFEKLAKN